MVAHSLIVVLLVVAGATWGQALAMVPLFYVLLPPVLMLAWAFLAHWAGVRWTILTAALACGWIAWGTVMYTGADNEVMEMWGLPSVEIWRR